MTAGQGIKLADIFLNILADSSGLPGELDKAEKTTKGWAGNLGGTVATLVGGAIVAGAAAAGAAIIGIGAASFDMAKDVEAAVGQVQTQLGLTEEEAQAFGDTIQQVYGDNFGESIEDVANGVAVATQNLQELNRTGEDLATVTEYAFALRDAFDLDINESTRTANQLMQELGITGEEAFGLITTGMQEGLNESDDLLDTLNEYAADFGDLGFTGEQVLSLLNSGLESGIYNTDKIADGMREFKINLLDAGRLESIEGISPAMDEVIASFQAGEITGVEAFMAIQSALGDVDDAVKQQELGVALFGSMWEDLGAQAILGLDPISYQIDDMGASLDTLDAQYQNLGDLWEGLKRRGLQAFGKVGDKLLEIANDNMPTIEKAFEWFEDKLPPIIDAVVEGIDLLAQWIEDPVIPAIEKFTKWWKDELWPAIQPVIDQIMDALIPGLEQLAQWAGDIAEAVFPALADAVGWVIENFDIIGPIIAGVGAVLLALTSPVAAVIAAVVLLATAWANNWGDIQGKANDIKTWWETEFVPRWEAFMESLKAAIDNVVTFWNEHIAPRIEEFFAIFTNIFEAFRAAFEGDWYSFGENLREAFDNAALLIQGVMDSLGQIMLEILTNAVNKMINFITETDWAQVGNDIIRWLGDGLTNAIPWLVDRAKDAGKAVYDSLAGFFGSHSPSELFEGLGETIPQGLAKGIGNEQDLVNDTARQMGGHAYDSMSGGGSGGGSGQSSMGSGNGSRDVHIHFAEPGPKDAAEAQSQADRMLDAVDRHGGFVP